MRKLWEIWRGGIVLDFDVMLLNYTVYGSSGEVSCFKGDLDIVFVEGFYLF